MAFTIPNELDAFNTNQAEVDSKDIDILVAAHNQYAVLSGCGVTQLAVPGMGVQVASGSIVVGGSIVAVSSVPNLTIPAADATNPRFDLVSVNNTGTVSVTSGTPLAEPVFPTIPANSVVLAAVFVPAAETTIPTSRITDKRILVALPILQPATPGTAQAGNVNIGGRLIAGGAFLKAGEVISFSGVEPTAGPGHDTTSYSKLTLYDTANSWNQLDIITKGVGGGYAGGGLAFFHTNGDDTPIRDFYFYSEVSDSSNPATRTLSISELDTQRLILKTGGHFYTVENAKLRYLNSYGVRPEDYGAVADGKGNHTGAITSGTATLTVTNNGEGVFSASDVGKTIWVFRAGAAGATLKTTIQAFTSSTQVTLAANAGSSVFSSLCWWGTDNTTAVSNALGEASALIFSKGVYIVDGTLSLSNQNFSVRGQGNGATALWNAKTNGNHFAFGFAGANISVSNISLYGPGIHMTSGAAIAFTAGSYFTCFLQNLEIRDVWDGLSVATTGGPHLQQVDFFGINNIAVNFSGGSLIYYRGLIYNFPTITGATLAITTGTPNLTSTVAAFTDNDVGKRIAVVGAGAAGVTLVTTITAVASATACTLAANAGTTVSGKVGVMTPPSVAGIAMYNGTPYVSTVDIVGQDVNVLIAPGAGQSVSYGFWNNLLCDSAHDVGLKIAPTTAVAGAVVSHNFINSWFASAGSSAQLDGGANQQGVRIIAAAATGNITGLRFGSGCRFVNSVKGGLFADGGGGSRITNLTIDGCEFDGNASTSNTYDQISLANVTDLAVTDNHISHTYFSPGVTDRYGINLASSCAGTIRYSGNIIINAATADILDATTVTTKVMSNPKAATIGLANGLNSDIDSLANDFLVVANPTGAFSLGGLTKGCDGRVVRILNPLNQTMTVVNEDASSTAGNRITTLTGGNVALRANAPSLVTLVYRSASSRWILTSSN